MLSPTLAGIADLYGLVWSNARGSRARYCTGMTLQAAGFLCSLGPPLFLGLAVNVAQDSAGRDIKGIVFWLSMILASVLVTWALNGPGRIMERQVAIVVRQSLVDRLMGNALDVDIRWHEGRHSGDTTHRIRTTVDAVSSFCESQFFYIKSVVTFTGATVVLLLLSWPVGLTALVGFLLLGWLMGRMDRGLRPMLDAEVGSRARLSGALADTLANITTVKTLGAGPTSRRHVRAVLEEVSSTGRRVLVPMERKWWLITYGTGVLNAGLLIGFAVMDWQTRGSVRVGFLVTISGYALALLNTVEVIGGHWQALLQFQAEARSGDELRTAAVGSRHENMLPGDWTRLRVECLDLRHPSRAGAVAGAQVTATNLELRRGERVALVGASGAGKSSLLRSLAGLYQCDRFEVSVDGRPVPQARSLAGLTGLITQETEVFADTVRNNIDLGTGADDARILRAVENAELSEVIAGLPSGLDTDLGERGVDLSGGQRQRVALARGLLLTEACSVLLLDEPTSSLDPVSEAAIVSNILTTRPEATIVAAVHRLHLLRHFERVVFMRDGSVVDVGTPAELADRQPDFRAMVESATTDTVPAA